LGSSDNRMCVVASLGFAGLLFSGFGLFGLFSAGGFAAQQAGLWGRWWQPRENRSLAMSTNCVSLKISSCPPFFVHLISMLQTMALWCFIFIFPKSHVAEAFRGNFTLQLYPVAGTLPFPLQALNLGCAAVIVAAKAFWLHPGGVTARDLEDSFNLYLQSGTADQVRMAILEAIPDAATQYDTPECQAELIKIVISCQM